MMTVSAGSWLTADNKVLKMMKGPRDCKKNSCLHIESPHPTARVKLRPNWV